MAKNKRHKDNLGQKFIEYLDSKCCQVAALCIKVRETVPFEFAGRIQGMGIDLRRWKKRLKYARENRKYYGQDKMKKLLYRIRLALSYQSVGVDIKYPRAKGLLENDMGILRECFTDWKGRIC